MKLIYLIYYCLKTVPDTVPGIGDTAINERKSCCTKAHILMTTNKQITYNIRHDYKHNVIWRKCYEEK